MKIMELIGSMGLLTSKHLELWRVQDSEILLTILSHNNTSFQTGLLSHKISYQNCMQRPSKRLRSLWYGGKQWYGPLITDMWTSLPNDCYMSLTCYFLDHNFDKHDICLEVAPYVIEISTFFSENFSCGTSEKNMYILFADTVQLIWPWWWITAMWRAVTHVLPTAYSWASKKYLRCKTSMTCLP